MYLVPNYTKLREKIKKTKLAIGRYTWSLTLPVIAAVYTHVSGGTKIKLACPNYENWLVAQYSWC